MSGLAMVAYTLVSVVTAHGVSSIEPLAVRLSSFLLASMLSVKWYEGDNASGPLFTPTLTRFLSTDLPTHPVLLIVYSEMTSDPHIASIQIVQSSSVWSLAVVFPWELLS
jgi:hypothetical protein